MGAADALGKGPAPMVFLETPWFAASYFGRCGLAFNRETSCFLTVVYLLTAIKKDPAGTVALHFSAQLLIWVAVKSFLFLLYAGNPGWELFEGQRRYNAHLLSRPEYYPFILCVFGFVWV